MKVLFLDIDNVLNRDGTKEKFCEFDGLDKALLERFLHWKNTAQPDLKIVLSSSWRIPCPFGDFMKHLNDNGITWIDVTPNLGGVDRGLEILAWLKDHPEVTQWAVLDDLQVGHVGNRLVQTSPKRGVENKHLAKINKLLHDTSPTN